MTESRPKTAFEEFLLEKQGKAASTAPAKPAAPKALGSPSQSKALKPTTLSTGSRPGLPSPHGPATPSPPKPRTGAAAGQGLQPLAVQANQPQAFQELVQAAASLATAAQSMARATPQAAAPYQALAKAAADLAASASPKAAAPLPPRPGTGLVAVDAAAASAGAANTVLPFGSGPVPRVNGSRPGTSGSRAPKFPAMDAMILLRQSELPPPGSAAPGGPGTARPGTGANPITHAVDDVRPSTSAAGGPTGSRAGSGIAGRAALISRSGAAADGVLPSEIVARLPVYGSRPGSTQFNAMGNGRSDEGPAGSLGAAQPGDAGSGMSQVLQVEDPNQQPLDPIKLFMDYPGRVKPAEWPPRSPITLADLKDDEMAEKYNTVLSIMKERMYARGLPALVYTFRIVDKDGSGTINKDEFSEVLASMNLGPGLVDERVVGMLLDSMDSNHDGRVNYNEFVNALKFGRLPFMQYNHKLRHKAHGNPDEPFGPSALDTQPFGVVADARENNAAVREALDGKWADVASAFKAMDKNNDGVINWPEFQSAMAIISEKFGLQLSAHEVMKTFREADWDYSQGIDYGEFLQAFSGGAATRFIPEFLKPKTMRCSQLGHPWEWRGGPKYFTNKGPMAKTLAESVVALERLKTASKGSGLSK